MAVINILPLQCGDRLLTSESDVAPRFETVKQVTFPDDVISWLAGKITLQVN